MHVFTIKLRVLHPPERNRHDTPEKNNKMLNHLIIIKF